MPGAAQFNYQLAFDRNLGLLTEWGSAFDASDEPFSVDYRERHKSLALLMWGRS